MYSQWPPGKQANRRPKLRSAEFWSPLATRRQVSRRNPSKRQATTGRRLEPSIRTCPPSLEPSGHRLSAKEKRDGFPGRRRHKPPKTPIVLPLPDNLKPNPSSMNDDRETALGPPHRTHLHLGRSAHRWPTPLKFLMQRVKTDSASKCPRRSQGTRS